MDIKNAVEVSLSYMFYYFDKIYQFFKDILSICLFYLSDEYHNI